MTWSSPAIRTNKPRNPSAWTTRGWRCQCRRTFNAAVPLFTTGGCLVGVFLRTEVEITPMILIVAWKIAQGLVSRHCQHEISREAGSCPNRATNHLREGNIIWAFLEPDHQ